MKKVTLLTVASFLMLAIMASCGDNTYSGYKKTESGLYYRFYSNNGGETPQIGDLVEVTITCTVNDTTTVIPLGKNILQLFEPKFKTDFMEGVAMMHKGDSASFIVNIDSTFVYVFGQRTLPADFKSTDIMRFDIGVSDFFPEEVYVQKMIQEIKENTQKRISEMKAKYPEETAKADADLKSYLKTNGVNATQTESGLYYVMTQEGNGDMPKAGKNVKVHYTGKLLDGTVFDSSVERGTPIEIPIGVGSVIPGWDEGILMMSKGEKGVLYIPFYLAYGDRAAGDKITPFSSLMFEVELVDFE